MSSNSPRNLVPATSDDDDDDPTDPARSRAQAEVIELALIWSRKTLMKTFSIPSKIRSQLQPLLSQLALKQFNGDRFMRFNEKTNSGATKKNAKIIPQSKQLMNRWQSKVESSREFQDVARNSNKQKVIKKH